MHTYTHSECHVNIKTVTQVMRLQGMPKTLSKNPEARRNIHGRSRPSGFRGSVTRATASSPVSGLQTCETINSCSSKPPRLSDFVNCSPRKEGFFFSRKAEYNLAGAQSRSKGEIGTQLSRVKQQCWVLFAGNLIKMQPANQGTTVGLLWREFSS